MHTYLKIGIIVGLILLTISALMMNSQNYVPANEMDVFTKNYAYLETFNNFKETNKNNEYTTYTDNSTIDSMNQHEITPVSNQCYKVGGMGGLVCSPDATAPNPKDIYSQAKGSAECQSYGLMNSTGYLCLNEEQKKMYMTRGGNASGGGGDIGLHSK